MHQPPTSNLLSPDHQPPAVCCSLTPFFLRKNPEHSLLSPQPPSLPPFLSHRPPPPVHCSQKDNPILKHIRNVAYEMSASVTGADFVVGKSAAAVFLSLRYHNLHKDYIYARLKEFERGMELRVLLVLCDIKSPEKALHDLSKLCVMRPVENPAQQPRICSRTLMDCVAPLRRGGEGAQSISGPSMR